MCAITTATVVSEQLVGETAICSRKQQRREQLGQRATGTAANAAVHARRILVMEREWDETVTELKVVREEYDLAKWKGRWRGKL